MYEFVYRITFEDGRVIIAGDEYLAMLCKDKAEQIVRVQRTEVHTDDWLEVTAVTMRNILTRIEASNAHT